MRALLDAGCSVNPRAADRLQTPLRLALDRGHGGELAALLRASGALERGVERVPSEPGPDAPAAEVAKFMRAGGPGGIAIVAK